MSEISYKAKSSIEAIERATAELRKEMERLETALDEQTGVVQPLIPYPVYQATYQTNMRSLQTPERAKTAVQQAYEKSLPLVEQNQAIIASNRRIAGRLKQFIENSKVCTTMQVKNDSRARWASRTKTVTADWFEGMQRAIPTHDMWPECEKMYKDRIQEIEKWEREIQQAAALKEQTRKAEDQKIEREVVRREFVKKYGLDETADLRDCLNAVLAKNKYLKLAYYLSKNRSDWSEGPHYARVGINNFKVETDLDLMIHEEISGYISDWDGDGRIFRDCTYSYDFLFGMANDQDPELYLDYTRLAALTAD